MKYMPEDEVVREARRLVAREIADKMRTAGLSRQFVRCWTAMAACCGGTCMLGQLWEETDPGERRELERTLADFFFEEARISVEVMTGCVEETTP